MVTVQTFCPRGVTECPGWLAALLLKLLLGTLPWCLDPPTIACHSSARTKLLGLFGAASSRFCSTCFLFTDPCLSHRGD